jgi:hypothetical protein
MAPTVKASFVLAIICLQLVASHGFLSNAGTKPSRLSPNLQAASTHHASMDIPIVCSAKIDYSAVNEYTKAHYQTALFDRDHPEERIYDGRALQSRCSCTEKEMLAKNGMVIMPSPLQDGIEWTRVQDVKRYYIPTLEKIIHKLFSSNLTGYCFWNPMLRGESYTISRPDGNQNQTPTANIAPMVHIDTDVGAFELKDLLDIVDKNSVCQSDSFTQLSAAEAIERNKRFVILNFWRNVDDKPVSSAPLAIYSVRYENNTLAFPNAFPVNESKWYIFPGATAEEVIVFYQYDRNVMQISDLFHCAITANDEEGVGGRRSFDVRALVILDEDVPGELDRYGQHRTRPVLSFEESGCFCDEQAEKRSKVSGLKPV